MQSGSFLKTSAALLAAGPGSRDFHAALLLAASLRNPLLATPGPRGKGWLPPRSGRCCPPPFSERGPWLGFYSEPLRIFICLKKVLSNEESALWRTFQKMAIFH